MRWFLLMVVAVSTAAAEVYECAEGRWTGRWMEVAATAYTPTNAIDSAYHESKGTRWRWILADGKTHAKRQPYGIAVKLTQQASGKWKPALPFGTRIYVPTGYGYLDRARPDERVFTVDDGSASSLYDARIGGRMHVDMRWISTGEALQWAGPQGHQVMRVFVIEADLPPPEPVRTWPEPIAEAELPPVPPASENAPIQAAPPARWGLVALLAILPYVLVCLGVVSCFVISGRRAESA